MAKWAVFLAVTTMSIWPAVLAAQETAESGIITANGVDLHKSPEAGSKTTVKLYVGRPIKVDDHNENWVHVTFEMVRGEDTIPMEGWVETKHVRARSRNGFSFQRRSVESLAVSDKPDKKKKKKKKEKKKKKARKARKAEEATAAAAAQAATREPTEASAADTDAASASWGEDGGASEDWGDEGGGSDDDWGDDGGGSDNDWGDDGAGADDDWGDETPTVAETENAKSGGTAKDTVAEAKKPAKDTPTESDEWADLESDMDDFGAEEWGTNDDVPDDWGE